MVPVVLEKEFHSFSVLGREEHCPTSSGHQEPWDIFKEKVSHHLCLFPTCSVRPREAATALACAWMQDAQLAKTTANQHSPACILFGSPPGIRSYVLKVAVSWQFWRMASWKEWSYKETLKWGCSWMGRKGVPEVRGNKPKPRESRVRPDGMM